MKFKKLNGKLTAWVLAFFSVWGNAAPLELPFVLPRDSTVVIHNDRAKAAQTISNYPTAPEFLVFDFDDDGKEDVAIRTSVGIDLFLGKDLTSPGTFSGKSALQILNAGTMAFGDLNGDHRPDFIVQGPGKVCVFFGGDAHPPVVDLAQFTGRLMIQGSEATAFGESMVAGDFNGDGTDDLVLGSPLADPLGRMDAGEIHMLEGKPVWDNPIVTVSTGTFLSHLVGSAGAEIGKEIVAGDVDGDGQRELIVSERLGVNHFEAQILRSTSSWPTEIDLDLSIPSLDVFDPGLSWPLVGMSLDLMEVGRDVLLMTGSIDGVNTLPFFLNFVPGPGEVIPPTGTLLVTPQGAHRPYEMDFFLLGRQFFGDFDGDGLRDLAYYEFPYRALRLSSDWGQGISREMSISFWASGGIVGLVMADVNGDGRKDVVLCEDFNAILPTGFGDLHVIYGHRPLRNPMVRVKSTSPQSSRVVLELSVEGEPTEMKLSGDINDTRRDQWVPYETTFQTDWTSAEGPKTVRVKFRNSVGRESAEATAPGNLAVLSEGLAVVHNRVREGQSAVLEYRFREPSTARVRVMGTTGAELRTLAEEEVPGGIRKWEWDGRTGSGQRVAAGIYPVVIEVNGRTEKTRVVVEW